MPNWVCSGFTVTGAADELARFAGMMIETLDEPMDHRSHPVTATGGFHRFDFGAIVPMPDGLGGRGQEDWAADNWGTKWNAQNFMLLPSTGDSIRFQFDTAWSFPTPVFEALADEFPELVFAGSAFEDNGAFELVGEFNGTDDWEEGHIDWVVDTESERDGDDDRD